MEKKRFEDAEVGDLVVDDILGRGYVQSFDIKQEGSVLVTYGNGSGPNVLYDIYGNLFEMRHIQVRPSLFYTDADGNKLTERPEPAIDWSKVEPGTEFQVGDTKSDCNRRKTRWYFRFFAEGKPWFSQAIQTDSTIHWGYARRIKAVG